MAHRKHTPVTARVRALGTRLRITGTRHLPFVMYAATTLCAASYVAAMMVRATTC